MYGFTLRYRAHNPYADMPRDLPTYPNLDRETAMLLTFFRHPRPNSFTNYPAMKPASVVRVGCFGDSFTYGSECWNDLDYPYRLQEFYRSSGQNLIEVINFGMPGTGFTEAFLLWERVGLKMAVDTVVLGPQSFDIHRDTSFHGPDRDFPRHARFIIDGDALRRLDPLGDSPWDRKRRVMRFIPHYRYLRYDPVSPTIIKALYPRKRQPQRNPFYYYQGDARTEAYEIYRRLFQRMADSGAAVFLLHSDKGLIELVQSLQRPNLKAVWYQDSLLTGFPYSRPGTHYSPYGNEVIATIVYDLLAGRSESDFELLKMKDFIFSDPAGNYDLTEYQDVRLTLNDKAIGQFEQRTRIIGPEVNTDYRLDQLSLLIIRARTDDNFQRCVFISLDEPLRDGAAVTLRFNRGGAEVAFHLGQLRLLAPGLPIGVLSITAEQLADGPHRLRLHYDYELGGVFEGSEPVGNAGLFVGETLVCQVGLEPEPGNHETQSRQKLRFRPVTGEYLGVYARAEVLIPLKKIAAQGVIMLDLKKPTGERQQFPFIGYEKQRYVLPLR